MDTEDMDVVHALANDDAESSNPQTDQNSTDALTYQDNYEAASIELTIEPEQDKEDEGQSERQEDERQEDEMAEITKTSKKQKSCEMDKFKRRLIRAIARLMRDEQAPSEELWAELKKQSGCDCKLLWDRMCTLTKKKLGKLFTAEDKIADINPIAQLTVTDWLLFDLVLVHEKIDVIGQDREDADAEESPKILEDLFAIVVVFDLERLEGDALTKAWFEATAHYNGTQRQCSPMLLQRRWYQLKQAVREKFYQFWYMYRGTQRYLQAAIEVKPTTLQMEIVKLYKYITTQPFPTWEELIKQKKVALPEDFERLQLAKRRIFRTETGPDLEVIEPHVETIDLDQQSDSEESRDSCSTQDPKDNVDLGVVKTEKVDEISDDEDDVRILESVQIPLETDTNAEDGIILRNSIEQNVEEHGSADIDNEDISIVDDDHGSINFTQSDSVAAGTNEITDLNTQNIDTADFQDDTGYIDGSQNDTEMVMPTIVASASIANISQEFDIPMPIITNVSSAAINTDEPVDDAVNSEIDGILQSVVENISTKNLFDVPQRTDKTLPTPDNMQDPDTLVENIIDEENLRNKNIEVKGENCMDSFNTAPNDFNIFDGIILEDDGIEYIEEEDHMKEINIKAEIETEDTHDQDCVSTPTIDLKLLLTPVVYTKKLDDMDVFRFIDYNAVKDKRVLENADSESKPVDKNSVKMEEISQERPSTPDSDAFSDSMSEYHSEVDSGSESINPSSWLLSKPRNVSYNPIQLCKNPDFNTRLKRLSAGFFSLERNRRLLKECKPLTIDLHKSFESKLVNNTLYLSGTKPTETKKDGLNENATGTTVRPTNLPIQNLVDNITNDILGATPPSPQENQCAAHQATQDSHLAERNKVINLPDIAQIRRLNERLLTAEVTPIQVSHSIKAPVSIVSAKHNLGTASENNRILQKNKDIICEGTELPMLPTVSDLDSGASSSLNKISLTTTEDKCDNLANITHKMKSLESINRSCNVSRGNFFNRFNNNQQQKTGPKKPMRANRVEVSWNPRENPNKMIIPQDRLLTSDTVDKILNVCNGNDAWFKNSKAYKKALRKKSLKAQKQKERKEALNEEIIDSEVKNNETTEVSIDNEVSFVSEEAPIENVPDNIIAIQTTNEINKVSQDKIVKRIEREKLSKHAIGRVKYCCWAREKVIKLGSGKRPIQKHKCPQPLCTCCCRQDLVDKMFEMNKNRDQLKRSQMSKRETNLSKPIIINVTSQQRLYKNSKEIPHKVSVGINTDFDPDFETTFAANLAEHKTSSKLVDTEKPAVSSIKVTIEPNMCSQANGQTQTSMNLIVLNENNKNKTFGITNAPNIITESDSFSFNEINSYIRKTTNVTPVKIGTVSQTNDSITLKDSNTFNLNPTLKPIVLNKNNLKFSVTSSNILQKNLTVVSNQNSPISSSKEFSKTRSVIVPKKRMSQRLDLTPPFGGDPKVALGEKSEKLDKVLFLSNDKWKTTTNQTPICLGKNKILLCSFEKPHMKNLIKPDDNNANQSQICSQNISPVVALPDGVRIVLLPNQELALSIDPGVELDSIQLEYLPSIMASIQQQLATADDVGKIATFGKDELKNKGDSNDLNNINLEKRNESEIKSDKKLIDNDTLVNATSLDCNEQSIVTSDTIIDITKERDTDNKEKNSNDKDENIHCQLDNSNICEVNLKDDSDLNKKTILSDLMEMSGISAEDTHLTSPTKQPELHPIPVIQRLHSRITEHNEKYINNPLFNNPVVKTALNRCPELCIVFSYTELRYASENNAQFFKMDIETGVVVPINLVIKKQLLDRKSNKPLLSSKSVIDLTDDPDEDETISIEEQNRQTGEVESTTEKQKDRVVPVKLYSAIHPSIIRQKLKAKSLLMQALKSNTKPITNVKKIRIIQVKRKRKQSLECVESIDLDSDTEQKESTSADVNLEVTPEKRKSVDDSDSDDEPLAFKAKRMKEPTEPAEPTESINVITDDQEEKLEDNTNHNTEMVTDEGSEATETVNENLTTEDTPQNKPDEPFVNPRPHLEPVVFEPLDFDENMAESSDDDCILGV